MANYKTDSRIVLTLDAGGTNMVFSAMRGGEYIIDPINLPSNAKNLDLCLQTLVLGFSTVIEQLKEKPVAISFAFPGPADYPHGIIGGYLPNFPSFRDGVALGPFLEEKFGIPVYINNDGDLYAYGEATVPKVTVTLRKSYGGAHIVMSCKQIRGDINYAWPSANIAVMGADGAVQILYGKEIKAVEDPAEQAKLAEEKKNEYNDLFCNPYQAAKMGYIDDIIEPRNTRFRVIRALEQLAGKKQTLPAKKHDNLPL